MSVTSTTPVLADLIHDVESVLADCREPDLTSERVALELHRYLGHPGLLRPEQREPDPERYRQHVLHAAEDGSFSVVALVWMPGQATAIHDHVSWCAIGIHQGQEHEVQYRLESEGGAQFLLPVGSTTNRQGSVSALTPPGDIHYVMNPGPEIAISIHVYGADVRQLGSSIRRHYEQPVRLGHLQPVAAWAALRAVERRLPAGRR
jgi:predicted metal-dependent enzyme (double-stranded beta helix superfamily)